MSIIVETALEGFALGAGLIIAIGAQNAFVLRQGLIRAHVLPIVAFCAASDALLIMAGALGLGSLIAGHDLLLGWVSVAGALFSRRLWPDGRPPRPASGQPAPVGCGAGPRSSPRSAPSLPLPCSTPHVYLDTVVLLGSISGRHPMPERLWFVGGAALASIAWFSALGWGARLLVPVFRRPAAWRVLDGIIALVMWAIAARLVGDAITLLG